MGLLGEVTAIGLSILVFLGYEVYLRRAGAASPMAVARTAHAAMRAQWVETVVGHPGTEILAIQTLRNSIMAASFMASTAVLALIGALNVSGFSSATGPISHLGAVHTAEEMVQVAKVILLVGTFFASFMFCAMAVRFFNHAGYLITSAVAEEERPTRKSLATAYLNRAGHQYSLGLRAFFACVPLLAALFSTYLMLPATLLLVWLLYQFDQISLAVEGA